MRGRKNSNLPRVSSKFSKMFEYSESVARVRLNAFATKESSKSTRLSIR